MSRVLICLLLLVSAFVAPINAETEGGKLDSSSLLEDMHGMKGLPGVGIVVEELDEDAAEMKLTEVDLHSTVELRLRAAGIKVLPDHRTGTKGAPCLSVLVTVLKVTSVHYVASVQVCLWQSAYTQATSELVPVATNWQEGGFSTSQEMRLGITSGRC